MLDEDHLQALIDAMFADAGSASVPIAEAIKGCDDERDRLELSGALGYCKALAGTLVVARARFERVLRDLNGRPPDTRARWFANAGGFFLRSGDFDRATEAFREADDIIITWSSRAPAIMLLESSIQLGFGLVLQGDRDGAQELCGFAEHLDARLSRYGNAHPLREGVTKLRQSLEHPPTASDVPLTFWFADVAFPWPPLLSPIERASS
jgi:hypothetical protein